MEDLEKEVPEVKEDNTSSKSAEASGQKEEKHKKKKKETMEDQLEIISDELKEVKDKYFRALAEMDNYKKRMTDDLKKERTYAAYNLSDKLIDSIEIFDQALNVQTEDPNFKNFLFGFRMIKDMFMNALNQEGVTLINTTVGEIFDPVTEHAVDTSYDETKPENTILKIVKKGYKFKDRLLRPAMVIINIKPKTENNDDPSDETEVPSEDIIA
ncbi:MAG: nucleotide exchange factor GrpE [Candidatus Izemoplasmatales bacterium]|jgi:molecular chaperone GrpE|nr:nucleotide exchange factor GrpE [Candidatus Izemoplasmatales bacterium]